MTNRAIIEITSINLGGASKTSSVVSVKSAQCINKEATSAKLRCSLSSNLINLKETLENSWSCFFRFKSLG